MGPGQERPPTAKVPEEPQVMKQDLRQGEMLRGDRKSSDWVSMPLMHRLPAWTIPVRLTEPGPGS